MTKNYYKETEYLLYNYKMFQINIENMESEIEYLKKEEDGMTGISYEGVNTSPTNKISSMTEDIALSNSERIHFLEHSIKRSRNQLGKIDRAMGGLSEEEKQILINRYFEGKQWYVVAYKVGYSERHCKRLRNKAIEKMIIGMYGQRIK